MAAIWQLLVAEADAGRTDRPGRSWLERVMAGFDWEARARVVESPGGLEAAILVLDRPTPEGTVTRLMEAGPAESIRADLREWGLGLSGAAGSIRSQVWRIRGHGADLAGQGFERTRTFWRMDRPGMVSVETPQLLSGYRLVSEDEASFGPGPWVNTYNASFAEHWRHAPLTETAWLDRGPRRDPWLTLMAVRGDEPGALVCCGLEHYEGDQRPQPVGIVETVGTVPSARRQGLAMALTAEGLRRLRARGALSASLYVDAQNPTRAHDIYRRLGFQVGVELDVFEYRHGP